MGDVMDQDFALEVLLAGHNAFLTGPPGSGKSWLLRKFVNAARKEQSVSVTASTGVAAAQVNGTTLHSWAGLGARQTFTTDDIATIAGNARVANRISSVDVLVIDEVSMLHTTTFEAANAVCKKIKKDLRPFGGIQVVLCGDFFQLPPVAKGEQANFIYGCETWFELSLAPLYLSQQFRQKDDALLAILTAMREGELSNEHVEILRGRIDAELDTGVVPTRLQTHNVGVDRVNVAELESLKGDSKTFTMTTDGPEVLVDNLRKSCLAPPELHLKKGAAVMFVKNNIGEGYVNGTLGTVTGFDDDGAPKVRTDRGVETVAKPQDWAAEDARGRKTAKVTQVPLRLAWAISIHKSQGMSLTAAEIDLSRAFVEGLGYVALSRLTSIDGVRLLGFNRQALAVSERARHIDAELRKGSDDVLAGGFVDVRNDDPQPETLTLF